MKNAIAEMKNSLDKLKRLDTAKESISKLEYLAIKLFKVKHREIIQDTMIRAPVTSETSLSAMELESQKERRWAYKNIIYRRMDQKREIGFKKL